MEEIARVTLYKSVLFGRPGAPVFLGVLELDDQHLITVADIEIFPGCQAEVFLQFHAHTEQGACIYKGKLEVVEQNGSGDPNMVGAVRIVERDFLCNLWVSEEDLKTKSLKLSFLENVKQEQSPRPSSVIRKRLIRPRFPASSISRSRPDLAGISE